MACTVGQGRIYSNLRLVGNAPVPVSCYYYPLVLGKHYLIQRHSLIPCLHLIPSPGAGGMTNAGLRAITRHDELVQGIASLSYLDANANARRTSMCSART